MGQGAVSQAFRRKIGSYVGIFYSEKELLNLSEIAPKSQKLILCESILEECEYGFMGQGTVLIKRSGGKLAPELVLCIIKELLNFSDLVPGFSG